MRWVVTGIAFIVLAVEESHVNRRIQKLLADSNNQLKMDDVTKIIGCWNMRHSAVSRYHWLSAAVG